MPIVTQTRSGEIPVAKATWKLTNMATGQVDSRSGLYTMPLSTARSVQTTTSFRGSVQDDYEGMTGEQIRRGLRKEYKTRYDNGHNFFTTKRSQDISLTQADMHADYLISTTPYRLEYKGDFQVRSGTSSLLIAIDDTVPDSTLDYRGRQFINRTIPTAPESDLATLLGEVRQRLPQLVGQTLLSKKRSSPQAKASGEYLNWEFGLRPLISEVQSLARSAADAGRIAAQLERDASRVVRRKRADPEETSTVVGTETWDRSLSLVSSPFGTTHNFNRFFGATGQPQIRIVRTTVRKYKFSGAYHFHLPDVDSFVGKLNRYEEQANRLLGTRITPEVIWNLAPWSWLIDWQTDIGRFISNITNLQGNGTVLRYGYVMCETHTTRDWSLSGIVPLSTARNVPVTAFARGEYLTKQRRRATPYGFGLNPSSFTTKQWAILAALGMTKGDKSMRWLS